MTRDSACSDHPLRHRISGYMAAGPDGLLSAQGMRVAKIAEVSFMSADRVRDVIHNFDTDGFDSLCPKYRGRPAQD
ncbi:helix-turn-helix domain-containing protein [Streptomyces anthocyanicus]|nr:helix-turn-helix domain-containing protein [Streptomyces anthocyanicus]